MPQSGEVKRKCLPLILKSQTSDGGWGPQPHTPAEAFDTAIVLLALQAASETQPIARARAFLISLQEADGAWPETTRPSGAQSYAERISTTAWAAYALLPGF
jgi:squalene cyclase